ncbi:hypothetical protein KUV26_17970 [Leisingera daeponensis]|uniref:Uncharacterized protein n=1 Tax=Leisingera daeponensis TaxID=405746 RepID=A0ABS7NJF1_9RHOB|nr:hypothetical protein [Leisingera daeponensis]MBY6141329.1 hypothetical protein [Leisingera daeponensis]
MTGTLQPLQLPAAEQILLEQMKQNQGLILDLHPLLDLLQEPEREDLSLTKALLTTIQQVLESQNLCLRQLNSNQKMLEETDRKIDRILRVLNLPLE